MMKKIGRITAAVVIGLSVFSGTSVYASESPEPTPLFILTDQGGVNVGVQDSLGE